MFIKASDITISHSVKPSICSQDIDFSFERPSVVHVSLASLKTYDCQVANSEQAIKQKDLQAFYYHEQRPYILSCKRLDEHSCS
jgi:hypothetical protein